MFSSAFWRKHKVLVTDDSSLYTCVRTCLQGLVCYVVICGGINLPYPLSFAIFIAAIPFSSAFIRSVDKLHTPVYIFMRSV